ncbi:MAG: peptidoglycan DD-metalloendopeptidase family protein [Bacillota bacterium]
MRFEEMNKNVHRTSGRRPRKFPSGQGFYLVVLICLGLIGATTFFALNNNSQSQNPQATQENGTQAQYIPGGGLEQQAGNATATAGMSASPKSTATAKPAAANLTVPVKGDIIMDYCVDKLVYSKTLNEWTTHAGVDIAAKAGTTVKAALDGVVEKAEKDAQMGYTVVLSHDGGAKTVYANLEKLGDIKAGNKVKAGDKLGTVGSSAISECEDPPHLHFEYRVNGKSVDPKKYLTGLKTIETTPSATTTAAPATPSPTKTPAA